jgi:lipoprotein-anchoring transpeptidase ErfK/SrfK
MDSRALRGAARLALVVAGVGGAGAPAQAQFGFSWFAQPPAPVVRAAPPSPYARRAVVRSGPHLGALKSAAAAAAKREKGQSPIVGPLMIMVSVNRQRLTVYDGDRPIVSSAVSTGKTGHETPLGVFSVIQKEILHHSNLYNDAPMPYMQRITWSGVALHAGPLPGHAASHGCIRLPRDFAVRLWGMTRVGARVIVSRNELTPAQFSDERLFALRDPTAAPTAAATPGRGAAVDPAALTDRSRAAGQVASLANLPIPPAETVVDRHEDSAAATQPLSAGLPSAYDEMAPTREQIAAAAALEPARAADATPGNPPQSASAEAAPAPGATPEALPADAAKPTPPKKTGPISIFVSRKEKKLFVRRGFEPVFDAPIAFDGEQPLGTHVYTATNAPADGTLLHWVTISIASPGYEPEFQTRRLVTTADARGRKAPVVVAAVPHATTASEALERVQVTPELRDRIADMITPGSSLIISDKGLGSETGARGTDFIVLTH